MFGGTSWLKNVAQRLDDYNKQTQKKSENNECKLLQFCLRRRKYNLQTKEVNHYALIVAPNVGRSMAK